MVKLLGRDTATVNELHAHGNQRQSLSNAKKKNFSQFSEWRTLHAHIDTLHVHGHRQRDIDCRAVELCV